jgi:hypothetical protein
MSVSEGRLVTWAPAWTREADARQAPRGPPSVDPGMVRRPGPGPSPRGAGPGCHVMSTAILNCLGRGAMAALKAACTSATGWTWLT